MTDKIVIDSWEHSEGWTPVVSLLGDGIGEINIRDESWPDKMEGDYGEYPFPDVIFSREKDGIGYWVSKEGAVFASPALRTGGLDLGFVSEIHEYDAEPLTLADFNEIEHALSTNGAPSINENVKDLLRKNFLLFYSESDLPFETAPLGLKDNQFKF